MNIIPKNRFILNPFIVYSIVWILVLLIYQLGWSTMYPSLSGGLLAFFVLTIMTAFIIGIIFYHDRVFTYKKINFSNYKSVRFYLIILYLFMILEFVFARQIPFLAKLLGKEYLYGEFGLPFIHVIIVNGFSFLFLYVYHCFLSSDNKLLKKKLVFIMILAFLPSILMFIRGMFIAIFIGSAFIYLANTEKFRRSLFLLSFCSMGVILLFGILGNFRTDTKDLKSLILIMGEATSEYQEANYPDGFFWMYIYVTSPTANLQYIINKKEKQPIETEDILAFPLYVYTPDILSKRISGFLGVEIKPTPLIKSSFNTFTVYGYAFNLLGWWGMIFTYLFMYVFVMVTMLLVPKASPYYVTTLASVCIVIVLNIFGNMFVFMGTVPMVLIGVLLSFKYFIKKIKNIRNEITLCDRVVQ